MDQFRPRNDDHPVREIQRGVEDLKSILQGFFKGRGIWIAIVILIALYLLSGFYVVQPGEKGVVLLFGKVSTVTGPGLRYRLPRPFMDTITVDVASVRRAEIGFRSDPTRTRPVPQEALMLTGDENIVDVQLIVQYVVNDPIKFLFGAQSPETALKASAEVALRGVVGESTIDYTMTSGRTEVQKKVELYLQRLLDNYNTGLLVGQARLLAVDPPGQVQEAFHDVVRAWEDRERLIKEADGYREDVIPKARGMAQQEIREAEAYKAQRVIRAKGDAARFDQLRKEYVKAPEVTRKRLYLESVERFLPKTRKFIMEGGESRVLPLLPLTQPQHAAQPQSSSDQSQAPSGKGK